MLNFLLSEYSLVKDFVKQNINFAYEQKYFNIVKRIILDRLGKYFCHVFLFGSRARNDFKRGFDIDVGIEGLDVEVFRTERSKIIFEIEESIVPYRIDLINFDKVSEDFKKETMKEVVEWKKC